MAIYFAAFSNVSNFVQNLLQYIIQMMSKALMEKPFFSLLKGVLKVNDFVSTVKVPIIK